MATMTIRLMASLDKRLNKLSEETGILKSSLILYAINDHLRSSVKHEIREVHPRNELVRMTLRIPDDLKALLEFVSKKQHASVNTLVNNYVYIHSHIIWGHYKQISKLLEGSTAKVESPSCPAHQKASCKDQQEDEL